MMNWSQAVTETARVDPTARTWENEPNADFYQTIIDNNLFAPLGTVLNTKPTPGENLKLIATFTQHDPADATAIFQETDTGEQKTVAIGDILSGYSVLDIQPKQVFIEKDGETGTWKRIEHTLLD